ncbi:hypothetical protein C0J50_17833 [Silurus asotus]|uniref:Uncharacterized protein n=1 Tax=Silurus asotus TaxID=30991 RepID=A0AAD5AW49_SILAS|nr:hypothetical protein C0J50_17833 [Silurus asotus]
MRAALPVLFLVALAGCQSAFCASLEVAEKEDASDERDETEAEERSEDMTRDAVSQNPEDKKPEERFDIEVLRHAERNQGALYLSHVHLHSEMLILLSDVEELRSECRVRHDTAPLEH